MDQVNMNRRRSLVAYKQSDFMNCSSLASSCSYWRNPIAILVILSSLMTTTTSFAFSSSSPSSAIRHLSSSTLVRPPSSSSSSSSSSSLAVTLDDVNFFYETFPVQASVLTCSVKASVADGIAQVKASNAKGNEIDLEFRRNVAYIIYGGIFIGLMCQLEYNIFFPWLFGTEQSLQLVAEKVLFDTFVSAPTLWLPPAYIIKALVFDYPVRESMEQYIDDIRNKGLLIKYWMIWVPAQTISFSVVPDHLRVAFMASISFFWFILLSSISSSSDE